MNRTLDIPNFLYNPRQSLSHSLAYSSVDSVYFCAWNFGPLTDSVNYLLRLFIRDRLRGLSFSFAAVRFYLQTFKKVCFCARTLPLLAPLPLFEP